MFWSGWYFYCLVYVWINECVSHILTFSPTPLSFYIHIIITSCKIEMIWIGNNIQSNRRFSGNTVLKTSILKARTLRYGRKTSNTIHMYGKAVFFFAWTCVPVNANEEMPSLNDFHYYMTNGLEYSVRDWWFELKGHKRTQLFLTKKRQKNEWQ